MSWQVLDQFKVICMYIFDTTQTKHKDYTQQSTTSFQNKDILNHGHVRQCFLPLPNFLNGTNNLQFQLPGLFQEPPLRLLPVDDIPDARDIRCFIVEILFPSPH